MALKTYDTIVPQGEYPATEPEKTYAGRVVNQNSGEYIRIWVGTEAEYKALGVAEPDVLYCLYEEESSGGTTEGMTPAILGVAVLGRTILGVTEVLPKLATPGISITEK